MLSFLQITIINPELMFLQRKKTVAMQRILTHIRWGYIYHTNGFVKAEKLQDLIEKFSKNYKIDLKEHQRYYQKNKGNCNCFFTCYPTEKNGKKVFAWWLLATKGAGIIKSKEQLKSAEIKNERVTWLDEYVVVKSPRKGKGKEPGYTWKMTDININLWLERIRSSIRVKEDNSMLKQCLWSLKRVPGFRGNRENVKMFYNVIKNEIKRAKSKAWIVDDNELKIGYIRALKNDFIDVSMAVENIKSGRKLDFQL